MGREIRIRGVGKERIDEILKARAVAGSMGLLAVLKVPIGKMGKASAIISASLRRRFK